jgi:ketosteroid isomerase-like protein
MPSLDPAGVLDEINRIWQTADHDDITKLIAPHFTDDAVLVAPSLARVARGPGAAAGSYADFARTAKIVDVQIEDPQVDLCGDVAVATMRWSMQYEFGGRRGRERGYDTYVFRRDVGRWQICWRSMVSADEPNA